MNLIGENIHIISKVISEAVKNRDSETIQSLAKAQTEAGADYLDLNLGPARKDPEDVSSWLVNTVQQVSGLPISLDTMNPVAMEAGLKNCKKRPLLNSASGKAESKAGMMPLALKYNTEIILSVITDAGCPPDVDARVESIMDTVAHANGLGIKMEDIRVDPIILPVSADQRQVREALEFIKILPDLLPGVKSVIGLSNVSNGTPATLREILNRTYLVMMERNGLYSAIVDVLDNELMELNRGGLAGIKQLIYRVMDGEHIDLKGLSDIELNYVKTARILFGDALYSHAWLES
jgi:5-methyltetrahydrofolate corrinoid/iron sulfur protein methyltransferase